MSEALLLSEAVPLGYAVMARIAENTGVRMLAIKGPILAMQGLREPRQSVDVDVLVDPAGFEAFAGVLESLGWHSQVVDTRPKFVPKHSANHRHRQWPCEVDVHYWFPGFLADASTSFEVLWDRRTSATLASRDVITIDPVAHGALAALHYLRDEGRRLRSADLDSLTQVMQKAWTDDQRTDLVGLASATGASESLGPLLRRLNLPLEPSSVRLAVSVEDWRRRSEAAAPGILLWLTEMRQTSWISRPRFLLRSLWPQASEIAGWGGADPPQRRTVLALRWKRFSRVLRSLRRAAVDLRRLGLGRHE